MNISAAGNVEVPAYLVLLNKGYAVHMNCDNAGEKMWIAEKDGNQFSANGPIELLGVVAVHEARGSTWQATDIEIDNFVQRYEI